MKSKAKKILKAGLAVAGVSTLCVGLSVVVKHAAKNNPTKVLRENGYYEINEALKSEEILRLSHEFRENGGDPLEFAKAVIAVNNRPDMEVSEFLDNYVSAEVKEEYEAKEKKSLYVLPETIVVAFATSTLLASSITIDTREKKNDDNQPELA